MHANPDNVKTKEERGAFGHSVRKWTESKVAHHKYLRGGEFVSSFTSRLSLIRDQVWWSLMPFQRGEILICTTPE